MSESTVVLGQSSEEVCVPGLWHNQIVFLFLTLQQLFFLDKPVLSYMIVTNKF